MHQNSGCAASTLVLALSLKLLAVPVSPSGPAFDEAPVKKVCKVAKALADVEGLALSKINNRIKQVSAANEATATLNLAAATAADTNSSTLYAAATGIASRCSTDAVNALATLTPIALTAATNGAKTSGHISEVIDILRQASKGMTTRTCLVKTGGGTTTTENSVTGYGCPAAVLETAEELKQPDEAIINNKGFSELTASANLHSGSSTNSCIFLAGAHNQVASLWQANGGKGPAVHIAQGFITITADSTATSSTATLPKLNAVGTAWTTENPTTPAQQLYNKIGELAKHTHTNCGDSLDEVLNTILTPNNLREALLAVIKKPQGAAVKPTEDEIATALINSVEPAGTTQSQKLKDKILNTLAPKLTEGSRSQVKLRTLVYPGEIQISTLAAIQKLKTKVETEASSKSCPQAVDTNQAQEEYCNAIGDANKEKCNNEKQCGYDDTKETGKKCTYNASKATAKGVPVTQAQTGGTEATTGNCKGKLEHECTKAQECKWENNSFKDSSILVNKKLALSMAATFVSLISF